MKRDHLNLAIALGHSWADRKAEALAEVSPQYWPEEWREIWERPLPFQGEMDAQELESSMAAARIAAADRWSELLVEGRAGEDLEAEEHDREVESERLLRQIHAHLPDGLQARRVGEVVVLIDRDGFERTVHSLDHAWQVVAEYEERRSLTT